MYHSSTPDCTINGVTLLGPSIRREHEVLTSDALRFVKTLHVAVALELDTEAPAAGNDDVAAYDERLAITTAPVNRAAVINAMDSGARYWIAGVGNGAGSFRGSGAAWKAVVETQLNLRDAIRGRVRPTEGPSATTPTVLFAPRALSTVEPNLKVRRDHASAGLVDVALFLFHNARYLTSQGMNPIVISTSDDAGWDRVAAAAEELLGLTEGTITVSVGLPGSAGSRSGSERIEGERATSSLSGVSTEPSVSSVPGSVRQRETRVAACVVEGHRMPAALTPCFTGYQAIDL